MLFKTGTWISHEYALTTMHYKRKLPKTKLRTAEFYGYEHKYIGCSLTA